jgi:hypothetical protein
LTTSCAIPIRTNDRAAGLGAQVRSAGPQDQQEQPRALTCGVEVLPPEPKPL